MPLSERPREPRPTPGFVQRWECPDCGTHTRYAACPACVAERQASLDTEPAKPASANPYARLRRWAHMLGYGGHFLTKGRRYSVTFRLLRDTRVAYRRHEHHHQADEQTGTLRAVDHLDDDTTLIVGTLTFAGVGWRTTGDALFANTAAAMARERRTTGREELAHEHATTPTGVLGVPPHVVQAIARHADVKITLKVYSHANLDAMRQALGKLDGRLS